MRAFYLVWANPQPASALFSQAPNAQIPSALSPTPAFPLPWSHYVRLLSVRSPSARSFYEVEALRGGWTIRELVRQIDSQFCERTALSKDKTAMLIKGRKPLQDDSVAPEEEVAMAVVA